MHAVLKLLAFGCFSFLCVSCTVTYGNKDIIDAKKLEALRAGKVTVNEVYEKLGQPSDAKRTTTNESHWTYRYRAAQNDSIAYIPMGVGLFAGGKNGNLHSKDFYFDSSDRLVKMDQDQKELYTSNLFSLGRTVGRYINSESDSSKRVSEEMKRIGKKFDKSKSSEDQLLEKAL